MAAADAGAAADGRLTPLDVAAFAVALGCEERWLEANAQTGGDWPNGACVETALDLRDDLERLLPESGPHYCWGKFVLSIPFAPVCAGAYEVDGLLAFEHGWVALDSGVVLDPTAGQFYRGGHALRLVVPGAPDAWRWVEEERDQA